MTNHSSQPLFLYERLAGQGIWDALLNPLMRPCVIEVSYKFADEPIQLALTQDQHVIEAFPSDAAHESLTDSVGSGCAHWGPDYLNLPVPRDARETQPVLLVVVANQKAWSFVTRCRFSHLVGDPDITR
jgi:hypothetical protein